MKKDNSLSKQKNHSNKSKTAVKKTANKKKYKLIKLIRNFFLFAVAVAIVIAFVFLSGFFNICEIMVEGNSKVSSQEIINYSQIQNGENIFLISKYEVENNVDKLSYIETSKMSRVLPNKIKIKVVERTVDYIATSDTRNMYIDKNGNILEFTNNLTGYILITGFSSDLANIKLNDVLNEKDLNSLNIIGRILDMAKENQLDKNINKVEILNTGEYILYMDSIGKRVYIGNEENLNTKFLYVKAILTEQEGKKGDIFVNVNLDNEYVYFRENIEEGSI